VRGGAVGARSRSDATGSFVPRPAAATAAPGWPGSAQFGSGYTRCSIRRYTGESIRQFTL